MKTVLAVSMAAARQVVWKLLIVLTILVVAQYGLFCLELPEMLPVPEAYWEPESYLDRIPSFGGYLEEAKCHRIFMVALGVTWLILATQGTDWSGKLTYTLRRLQVCERGIATAWAVLQMLCYGILWATELAVVLLCWRQYGARWQAAPSSLELFTQFYRNDFLHGLFPLHDISGTASVTAMILVLSLSGAYASFAQRRGKNAWSVIVVVVTALWSCVGNSYRDASTDILVGLLWVPFLIYYVYRIWWGDYEEV